MSNYIDRDDSQAQIIACISNGYPDYKPQTNANRIRAMSDEELAEWIATDLIEPGYNPLGKTKDLWLDWLRQEVKDG